MPRFGFCGGDYTPKSLIADSQRLVNFFPEVIQSGLGRDGAAVYLIGTPGLLTQFALADGPPRGQFTIPRTFPGVDRSFIVSGGTLYELFAPPTAPVIQGRVANDNYPVFMAANKSQLAIASAQHLYIFNLVTNTLTGPILDTQNDPLQPISVVYNNGFFVANCTFPLTPGQAPIPGTNIRFSAPFDGTVWDPIDEFDAEASGGTTLVLLSIQNQVWAFTEDIIEPFQATTDPNNPFQPVLSGIMQIGIGAAASAVVLDNAPIWLGSDKERGGISIWTALGYTPTRISNVALDATLDGYNRKGVQLARSFAYNQEGHSIYQISFPDLSVNATWRYDKTLPPELAWYEVGYWNPADMNYSAHKSLTHSFAFGMHLVGDRGGIKADGTTSSTWSVFEMSTKYFNDDGFSTRRLRRTPHLTAGQLYLFFQKLEIVAEAGLGLNTGQGSDPQIMIRWSDNGGKTWKSERWRSLGKIGKFRKRIRLWKLGRSLDRVFEVVFSDPVPIRLIDGLVTYAVGKA